MSASFSNLYLRWHFRNEGPEVLKIVIQRPKLWEYLLVQQLLNRLLSQINFDFDTIRLCSVSKRRFPSEIEFALWVTLQSLTVMVQAKKIVPILIVDLRNACGPPGVPGDAILIRKTILRLKNSCSKLVQWEQMVASTYFPVGAEKLRPLILGWGQFFVASIVGKYADLMSTFLQDPETISKQRFDITVAVHPNLNEYETESLRYVDALANAGAFATSEGLALKAKFDRELEEIRAALN